MKSIKVLLVLVASFWCSRLPAPTLFVGKTGTNNGTCGAQATPCLTIQFTYDARAIAGDEIRVLPGIYKECVDAFPSAPPPKPVRIVANDTARRCKNPDPLVISSDTACQLHCDGGTSDGAACTSQAQCPGGGICAPSDADCTLPEICLRATVVDGTGVCDGNGNAARSALFIAGNGASVEGFAVRGAGLSGITGFGGVAITGNLIRGNASPEGGGIFLYSATCYYGDSLTNISDNEIAGNSATDAGGGILVLARAFNQNLAGSPPCDNTGDSQVTIDGNTITGNAADGFEGGGLRLQTFTEVGRSAEVVVTQNTISNNTITGAGSYGYGGGLWASTFGYGDESIEITENKLSGNASSGDGGGLSAWLDSCGPPFCPLAVQANRHSVLVDGNQIENNIADGNGGGLDLFLNVVDLSATQSATSVASNNTISGNEAVGFVGVGGGGGMLATLNSNRTSTPNKRMSIVGNTITGNISEITGGGATLYSSANADPDLAMGILGAPATSSIGFSNNLVADNQATNGGGGGSGGGIFALLQSTGEGSAAVDIELSTLTLNVTDIGGAGIEVESFTQLDSLGVDEGLALLNVDSAIIADNSGFGIGGPLPGTGGVLPGGTGNLEIDVANSDFFANTTGNFELTILPVVTQTNIRLDDPALDPVTFDAQFCERIGKPNANALADVTGDDLVSGVDILNIAVAFGAGAADLGYDPFADLDGNGIVDGNDLAFVAANIGETCPP